MNVSNNVQINENNKWFKFIDRSLNNSTLNKLHYQSKLLWYGMRKKKALSLGTGAGREETDLINKHGWIITGIDIEPYSNEVILKQVKKNKFIFHNVSFEKMQLTGKYDFVFAYNSLPFMNKKYLSDVVDNIILHTKKDSILSINMFGNTHSFVANGTCFSITISYMKKLFSAFKILYINREQYDINPKDHWDTIDMIAIKK
jgi:SAM-dependent methyltransferase